MTTFQDRGKCLQTTWMLSNVHQKKNDQRICTLVPIWDSKEESFAKQQVITKIKMPCANISTSGNPTLHLNNGIDW